MKKWNYRSISIIGSIFFLTLATACSPQISFFRSDYELDELDLEINDPDYSGTITVLEVDQKRTGLIAAFGPEKKDSKYQDIRGYVQVFTEDFGQEYDGGGLGGGIIGIPVLDTVDVGANHDLKLILPFKAGFNFVATDATLTDSILGNVSSDADYAELEADLGFGVDFCGFQPSVGMYVSAINGEVDATSSNYGEYKYDLEGENLASFINLRYKHEDFPAFVQLRALGGDVQGVYLNVGVSF